MNLCKDCKWIQVDSRNNVEPECVHPQCQDGYLTWDYRWPKNPGLCPMFELALSKDTCSSCKHIGPHPFTRYGQCYKDTHGVLNEQLNLTPLDAYKCPAYEEKKE